MTPTMPIEAACFVDANILFYMEKLKSNEDFASLLERVYRTVYIHEEVYGELDYAGQRLVDRKCASGDWVLFQPLETFSHIPDDYRMMLAEIQSVLLSVDAQRGKYGSAGIGEVASLASAYLLNAQFICSNDFSIREVIQEVPLQIYPEGDDSKDPMLITQHRLIDFCFIIVNSGLMPRNSVRKFYQIAHIDLKETNRKLYDQTIKEFDERIPHLSKK